MLSECEEIGLTVNANEFDAETISLVCALRRGLKKVVSSREEKKAGGRRGRR